MRTLTPLLRSRFLRIHVLLGLIGLQFAAAPAPAAESSADAASVTIAWIRQAFDQANAPFHTELDGQGDLRVTLQDLTVVIRVDEARSAVYFATFAEFQHGVPVAQREAIARELDVRSDYLYYVVDNDGRLAVGTPVSADLLRSHNDVLKAYGLFLMTLAAELAISDAPDYLR